MDGQRIYCPRGRLLGSSSSINGMVYVRGHAHDYDRWIKEDAKGWSYFEVLPYFTAQGATARASSPPGRSGYCGLRGTDL